LQQAEEARRAAEEAVQQLTNDKALMQQEGSKLEAAHRQTLERLQQAEEAHRAAEGQLQQLTNDKALMQQEVGKLEAAHRQTLERLQQAEEARRAAEAQLQEVKVDKAVLEQELEKTIVVKGRSAEGTEERTYPAVGGSESVWVTAPTTDELVSHYTQIIVQEGADLLSYIMGRDVNRTMSLQKFLIRCILKKKSAPSDEKLREGKARIKMLYNLCKELVDEVQPVDERVPIMEQNVC
jgi:DNA repair exonuclease SbcCD ATPase subunit